MREETRQNIRETLSDWWHEVVVPLASALAIAVGAIAIGGLMYQLGKGDGAADERAVCAESSRVVVRR